MKKITLWSLLVALLLASSFLASAANADESAQDIEPTFNEATEIRPDIGPNDDKKGVVGENGYKVFHPGAIAVVEVASKGNALASSATRTGSTDAWLAWVFSWDQWAWGWDHFGSHISQSTISEQTIQSQGRLKVTVDPSWRTTCFASNGGSYAGCTTHFFQLIPRTILGETSHYFNTPNYNPSSFTTSDSA